MARTLFALASILLSLSTAGAAAAQITEAEASREIRRLIKLERKALRAALGDQRRIFTIQLSSYEDDVLAGADHGAALVSLATHLEEAVSAHHLASAEAANEVFIAAANLLTELADAGVTNTPIDLSQSQGGAIGDFGTEVGRELEKSAARIRKSLARTSRQLEKKAGVALGVRIPNLSSQLFVVVVNPGEGFSNSRRAESIDAILSSSELDVENDGVVCASGSSVGDPPTVGLDEDVIVTPVDARWSHCFTSVSEGNWILTVRKTREPIGLR